MRKRALSIMLTLCLVLTLLPATALAITNYMLYVGNTRVYYYDTSMGSDSGTIHYWKEAESGDDAYAETGTADDYLFSVSFDRESGSFTLTLNGVDITSFSQNDDNSPINAYGICAFGTLNIVLADGTTNSVDIPSSSAAYSYGIYTSGSSSLTMSGNGALSAKGGTFGIMANYITISGGAVSSTGGAGCGISPDNELNISGGSFTASGGICAIDESEGYVNVSMTSYKYITSTSASAPDTGYTRGPETPFENSQTYKYVKIIPCPDVYVGDAKVSGVTDSGNISYWINDKKGSITSTDAGAVSYNVKYDEATQTLTLKNVMITSFYSDGKHQYGIYSQGDLNVLLEGNNNAIGTTDTPEDTAGIFCKGNLSLSATSGGSLSIVSEECGIESYNGSVSITGGEVSVISGRNGVSADGDIAVNGAGTALSITTKTTESDYYGIKSNGEISIADAEVSVERSGDSGKAIRAQDAILISGGADITIVEWGASSDYDSGLFSNGYIVIGGSAVVDICSQNIGIYAADVYFGYVWNGEDCEPSGSPSVKVNDPGSIAAITPLTEDDFTTGQYGVKAAYSVYVAGGAVETSGLGNLDTARGVYADNSVTVSGGALIALSSGAQSNGICTDVLTVSGGTFTATGEQAVYCNFASLTLPAAYKYRVNTEITAPDTPYSFCPDTPFDTANATTCKYVHIAKTFDITSAEAENGSFTVMAEGVTAESAAAGDTVTLTAAPVSGYSFSAWNVYKTGDAGTAVEVSGNYFTMPACAVTVEASFTTSASSGGTPSRTITVTETSSSLFSGAQGAVKAEANMTSAFSSSVEVKVTDTDERASGFGLGIGNTVYPFDIPLYIKGTNIKTEPKDGYAVTISLPVPDNLLDVKEQLSVAHKADNGSVTAIASELRQINGVWYLVFKATEFSPYALVVTGTGAYDETAGLPYYVDLDGNEVFIGFAASGKCIAPSGVTVLFKENAKTFTDVGSHWAKDCIEFVTERKIFFGTESNVFSPDSGMTRAMFATVVGRLYERSYGQIGAMSTHAFTDCDYNDYYGKYVDWAAENGIIEGYGSEKFGPGDSVTREQMAAILYRFADFLGILPNDMDTELSYPDAGTISNWAQNAALYCQSTGIITGRDGGNFVPQDTATRAEVAVILERFIENILG